MSFLRELTPEEIEDALNEPDFEAELIGWDDEDDNRGEWYEALND
jgi:hypothetical protein